jgi:hypothetical protein
MAPVMKNGYPVFVVFILKDVNYLADTGSVRSTNSHKSSFMIFCRDCRMLLNSLDRFRK